MFYRRRSRLAIREKANDEFMKASYVVELGVKLLEESFKILIRYKEQHGELPFVPCKVIRIPESRKFLLVEIGIPGVGI